MKKEYIIKLNETRVITLNNEVRACDIVVSLVDRHGASFATYEFYIDKIQNIDYLKCLSNNYRIRFNIEPSYSSEIVSCI